MRKKLSVAVFFLILVFTNCKRGGPCDNAGAINCVGIYYGSTTLSDSSINWLPTIISQNLSYISKNDTTVYAYNFVSKTRVIFKDIFKNYTEQRTCGTAYCQDYSNSEKEAIEYQTNNAPFNIELKREKDYYEYLNIISTSLVENSKDRLMVNLTSNIDTSKYSFKVLINQKDSANGYRYYDSLTLGTRTHKNTYECFYPRINQTGLYILGIYYTTDNGLVGYYYNNKQVWYVK